MRMCTYMSEDALGGQKHQTPLKPEVQAHVS